ncbi:MAG TPA: tetratricopeptide repeat protein [Candidatus Omnitrophota bacterium]|nr:tetratricopeptide repeat protein [Candidatus Omnitrophota bacterium]HSA30914.1 tetratricopeptide repeat protein [Candidatus Omnitrophota bacterium]
MERSELDKTFYAVMAVGLAAAFSAGAVRPLFAQTAEVGAEAVVEAEGRDRSGPEVMLMETDLELEHVVEASPQPVQSESSYEKGQEIVLDESPEAAPVEAAAAEEPPSKDVITEQEILKTSRALRQAIEQNKKLLEQNRQFEEQLRILRGQNRLDRSRAETLESQVQQMRTETEDAVKIKERYDERINDLSARMQDREQDLNSRIAELEGELKRQETLALEQKKYVTYETVGITKEELDSLGIPEDKITETLAPSASGLDVVSMLAEMEDTQKQIREDEARLHYNMGNIFFHKGKYEQAAEEYRKTLELNPADASAHFNLAFVCGDYLKDFPSAVAHYEEYLFLNPDAEDSPLVQEKVLEAKLYIRSQIDDMKVERDVQKDFGKTYAW